MTWELGAEHLAFRDTCRAFTDREVRPLVDDAEAKANSWPVVAPVGRCGPAGVDHRGGVRRHRGDSLTVAILAEELSRASGGIAVTALVSAYMAGPHLSRYGSAAQQQRWCAALAAGEAVAAIAVTEPGMGSDVAGMASSAKRTDNGWVLQGRKMFITNAGLADVLVVAARTLPIGTGARHAGVTMFLVEKDAPGLTLGRRWPRWAGTPRTPGRSSSTTCTSRPTRCSEPRAAASSKSCTASSSSGSRWPRWAWGTPRNAWICPARM